MLNIATINKITTEIQKLFPHMSQDNVDCITKYMSKHTDLWSEDDIPAAVQKCLPEALVRRDHSTYLILGIILTMFINLFINVVLYLATNIYQIPFKNKNIETVTM